MISTVYWQWGCQWVSRILGTPRSRSKLNFSERPYRWLPDHPLLQGSPTLTGHENHLEDLLSQTAGSLFRNSWFSWSGVGSKALIFKEVPGCSNAVVWVQTRKTFALLGAGLPCIRESEWDTAYLTSCCLPDPPSEQPSGIPRYARHTGPPTPSVCALFGSSPLLYIQETGQHL